eukprot:CAMPEP_0174360630 /NCGR_PEP_ID=MMETSP0811_2-20130205/55167_1 /TAXON_ID=73025 ORGANISM="Eutreptiella gymnastica-like, Strain CCMP1594" /NCGR_SAMPLE_ID=MMETSP0811_2 /ASSEMBLY_ACC=CAM_ASM_000667 /LENGTH=44 /DNA_ID= /DNA_START= /DNA_END= /DNA_ORIENTATION=
MSAVLCATGRFMVGRDGVECTLPDVGLLGAPPTSDMLGWCCHLG